jgi:hypothetical protein
MSFRFAIIAFILAFTGAAAAERIEPVKVRAPVDGNEVHKKCAQAFAQLQQDRLEKEAKENFSCFAILDGKDVKGIEAEFMILCTGLAASRAEAFGPGNVTIDIEELKTSFNQGYRPLIQTSCTTREALRISRYNASHSGTSATASGGSGRGMREGCFSSNTCY